MSTRSCIARNTPDGFKGVYHHWDGYPKGLGATLFELRNGHFKGDTQAMLKFLIDTHPAGWSTIQGADFRKKPGYDGKGPRCYCHGARSESANEITHCNASSCGCEWAYVFEGDVMNVLSSEWRDGGKMIGMFGYGGSENETRWCEIAEVDLNGEEPKWEAMDDGPDRGGSVKVNWRTAGPDDPIYKPGLTVIAARSTKQDAPTCEGINSAIEAILVEQAARMRPSPQLLAKQARLLQILQSNAAMGKAPPKKE